MVLEFFELPIGGGWGRTEGARGRSGGGGFLGGRSGAGEDGGAQSDRQAGGLGSVNLVGGIGGFWGRIAGKSDDVGSRGGSFGLDLGFEPRIGGKPPEDFGTGQVGVRVGMTLHQQEQQGRNQVQHRADERQYSPLA